MGSGAAAYARRLPSPPEGCRVSTRHRAHPRCPPTDAAAGLTPPPESRVFSQTLHRSVRPISEEIICLSVIFEDIGGRDVRFPSETKTRVRFVVLFLFDTFPLLCAACAARSSGEWTQLRRWLSAKGCSLPARAVAAPALLQNSIPIHPLPL